MTNGVEMRGRDGGGGEVGGLSIQLKPDSQRKNNLPAPT